ncbi:MAG: PQQ-like beta-propeller repeat protein, partial [Deltaproteobacteria bacterium]|nr:PQQ-like beta-propeller repeat protein [Deltaproteobacteria bacterium]
APAPAAPPRPPSGSVIAPALPPGMVASIRILTAAAGDELAQAPLPAAVGREEPRAACRTALGYDVWAWTAGALRRIAIDAKGARVAWQLGIPAVGDLDLGIDDRCDDTIIVGVPDGEGELIYALDRVTGAPRVPPVAAFGHWRARQGDGIELATAGGIERRDRALGAPESISTARVGRRVAARGDRRLVRTRGARLALLDGYGAVTTLGAPVGVGLGVLGDRAILSGPWHGIRTLADDLRRFALPLPYDPGRDAPLWAPPAIDDADLADHIDLPPVRDVRNADSVPLPGAGMAQVAGVVVDPDDPATLYAVPLEAMPSAQDGAGLASFDLRTRQWRWHRADGCAPGAPSSIAIADDVVVCAAESELAHRGAVRATGKRDGAPRWEWTGRSVGQVVAAGSAVAILSGGRVFVLDAATGAEVDRFAVDDGWIPRLAVMRVGAATLIISAERGAVVARIAGLGLPVWAVRVRGLVTALEVAGDRVAVSLDSGELYLLDPKTGQGHPVGGLGAGWTAPGGGDRVVVQAQDGVRREWRLTGYSLDGVRRFRTALTLDPSWFLASARGRVPGTPLPLAWGPALRNAALVEPRTGALRALYALPERAVGGLVFSTIVDGAPVAGAVLSHPLAILTF